MQRIFAFLIFSMLLISGCTKPAETPAGQPPSENGGALPPGQPNGGIPTNENGGTTQEYPLKGVSLSPKSYSSGDFTGFFTKANEAGEIVMWAGDWNELSNTQSGSPKVVTELSSVYGYTPLVEAQFFTQDTGVLVRPLDETNKNSYKESAASFAEKYKPKYMGFGIEVNVLHEKSPEDFENFATFYGEVYDAVKAKSPNTKVFTVFQLEKMKGLSGGLFGGENNPENNEWALLEKFPKSDAFAFTTYPCLIYKSPSEIPEDYYSEIKTHTSKPILFTESGWFREGPAGWESSEAEQEEFINRFFQLTNGVHPEIVVWSFLYDQQTQSPFNTMGLLKTSEETSPAFEAWKEG